MSLLRCLLPCFLFLGSGSALAELEKGDAPITLVATPQVAAPGTTITLSGQTPFVQPGAKTLAQLAVVPPGGSAQKLSANLDDKGKYSVSFKDTKRTGIYHVAVVAPDGKGKSLATFHIVGGADAAALVAAAGADVKQTEAEGLQKIRGMLQQVPETTGKAEAIQKLDDLQQKYTDVDGKRDKVDKALDDLVKAHGSVPSGDDTSGADAGDAFDKDMGEVAQQAVELQKTSLETREQFKKTQNGAEACDMLDNAIEMFNLLSTVADLEGAMMDKIFNIATDKVIPAVIDSTPGNLHERTKLAEAQKVLFAAAQGSESLLKSVRGLLGDMATFGLKTMYEALCTRFEGPVDAMFVAHMFNDNSEYWSYSIHLVGKLVLSEPKSAGDASSMSGYISGNAVDYDVKEDALQLDPRLRQKVLYHELIAPKHIPAPVEENGTFFNLKSPLSYYIRIKATRDGDKLTFKVGEASRDLSDDFNRGIVYYVFNAGIMPMLVHQDLPMEKAQFIFSRGIHVEGGTPSVTITHSGSTSQFERTFTRDVTTDNDQIKVHWDVKLKACSPGCTKSTLDKIKDLSNGK